MLTIAAATCALLQQSSLRAITASGRTRQGAPAILGVYW